MAGPTKHSLDTMLAISPQSLNERIEERGHFQDLQLAQPGATQSSPLLTLPAELRNRIYQLVLFRKTTTLLKPRKTDLAKSSWRLHYMTFGMRDSPKEPSLLRICSQIRHEATSIHYHFNTFCASSGETLELWLTTIGAQKSSMLQEVWVYMPHSSLGVVLRNVEVFEERLAAAGVALRDNSLRVSVSALEDMFFSKAGIEARMDQDDWAEYWRYRQPDGISA